MPDPARTADAKVLEIPVTIQGSKLVDGTDHRELFTETTKTQVVFDGGAALNLEARVVAGQSLFLRNEVTGREILCRVMEAPAKGQTGPTELEFTVSEAGFWDATPEQIQAASEKVAAEKSAEEAAAKAAQPAEKSETQNQPHVDSTLAMMGSTAATMTVPPKRTSIQEELMAAHEAAPETPSAPSAASTESHEEVIPAHEQPNVETTSEAKGPDAAPEFNLKKFEDTLAALLDGDARRARRAASGKEKAAAKAAAGDVTIADEHAEPGAEAPAEPEVVVPKISIEQRLTTGRGAVITGACASAVIAVCLFLIARAVFYPSSYEIERPAPVAMKTKAPVGPQKPITKPGATVAAETTASAAVNGKKPAGSTPSIPVAKNSVPKAAPEGAAKAVKPVESEPEPTGPRVLVSRSAITVDTGTRENHSKPEPDANGNIPAKILSQVQPIYPSWAKELDVNGVVTLDATIDTRGNITQTKVLSGPRELQHAAEQAVGLWIFEPAKANGVPVVSHMTLTVEFQR